jgi:Flp pilus assembly pilin Flp
MALHHMDGLRRALTRLIDDDSGQDLVEYALLTGVVVALAGLVLPTAEALGDIYESWNTSVWNLWEPPPPGS